MSIQQAIQSSSPGNIINLLDWDLSAIGGATFHFAESVGEGDQPVEFAGNTYTPIPFHIEGFERSSSGTIAQPTLSIADVSGGILASLQAFGDLIGTKVTRIRTFSQFLATPGSPKFPDEVYYIERKASASKFMSQFTLSSLLDMQGLLLPKRMVLKDVCTFIYRTWRPNTGDFYNTPKQCPYTGSQFFTKTGEPTIYPAEDACGKRYADCIKRYPRPKTLPTRAFPGASHVRK